MGKKKEKTPEKAPAVPRGPVEVLDEAYQIAPEPVQKLLDQLDEERATGDKEAQKKTRRMLRKRGFYLSKQDTYEGVEKPSGNGSEEEEEEE